jgi:periplasmic protein CpxP/Spy
MSTTTRSIFTSTAARLFGGVLIVPIGGTPMLASWSKTAPGAHMHGGPGMMGLPMRGHMLAHMLDSVNATPEQRAQIDQITSAAKTNMQGQWQAGRALHTQMMQLLTQPVVDANAVEALRQQMLQQHDTLSKGMTQTMVQIANVLTPAQRSQLAANMAARAAKMQGKTQ